ncbi:hypothetical protein BCR35DRAFT_307223 [Leucosporidium creatinivorum]|uniref:Uncharacterized protein n=1 Tax=Leucosporidium creatinivorum TaxID=106004 RepID=A0A1Y2ENV6_9BASI|nr:hypothetical protein BCR35DRAFT_307223 [Leucosporidium creatinivorum]
MERVEEEESRSPLLKVGRAAPNDGDDREALLHWNQHLAHASHHSSTFLLLLSCSLRASKTWENLLLMREGRKPAVQVAAAKEEKDVGD